MNGLGSVFENFVGNRILKRK